MKKFVFSLAIVFLLVTANITLFAYHEETQSYDHYFSSGFKVLYSERLDDSNKTLVPINRLTTSTTTHSIEYSHHVAHQGTSVQGIVTVTLSNGTVIDGSDLFTITIEQTNETDAYKTYHSKLTLNPMNEDNVSLIRSINKVSYTIIP